VLATFLGAVPRVPGPPAPVSARAPRRGPVLERQTRSVLWRSQSLGVEDFVCEVAPHRHAVDVRGPQSLHQRLPPRVRLPAVGRPRGPAPPAPGGTLHAASAHRRWTLQATVGVPLRPMCWSTPGGVRPAGLGTRARRRWHRLTLSYTSGPTGCPARRPAGTSTWSSPSAFSRSPDPPDCRSRGEAARVRAAVHDAERRKC
jgi:hypothetical protein